VKEDKALRTVDMNVETHSVLQYGDADITMPERTQSAPSLRDGLSSGAFNIRLRDAIPSAAPESQNVIVGLEITSRFKKTDGNQ
jgi:hypothetical protein